MFNLFKAIWKKLITDVHTGPWNTVWERIWYWNKFIMKNSYLAIVTNKYIKDVLKYKDVKFFILEDKVPDLTKAKKLKLKEGFNIAVVNTFSEDEPLDQVLLAAEKLPNVNFYITGNLARAKPKFIENKPKNVFYTNFLPENKYVGLLKSVDGIMILTTRNHTILSGAYEAVAVNKPMVISNWPVLRDFFKKGATYTNNSTESIVNAVKILVKNRSKLKREVRILKQDFDKGWQEKFDRLMSLVR